MNNKNFQLPFFILGNPRSGTSLFRLMLNSHPNVVVPPESGFLQWWYSKYKNWSIRDSQNIEFVKIFIKDILSSKKIEDWKLDSKMVEENIFKFQPSNYGELSSLIYYSYKNNSDIKLIGDKNNYYIHYLSTLDSIYPTSKYIHLIRDGRDVACSYKKIKTLDTNSLYKPNLNTGIQKIALEWKTNINGIDTFLENKKAVKIRYEDLLLNPEEELKKVCNFLEISFHKQMLDFFKSEFNDEPLSTRDWKMKTFEPLDKSNFGKYKNILSDKEIVLFNKVNQNLLSMYGYEV
ncbi:MAG: sulfotransferase [Flavobacteriaceae bacterium]|nr:sulfotransferase [Flavobacteriaceae bacterium]